MFKQYYSRENWELKHSQDVYPYVVTTISALKYKGYVDTNNVYFTLHDNSYVMFSTDWRELIELCTNENVMKIMSTLSYFACEPMENCYSIIKISATIALQLLSSVSKFDFNAENFFIENNISDEGYTTGVTIGKDLLIHHPEANNDNGLPLVEIKPTEITADISKYTVKQKAGWLFNNISDKINLLNTADMIQYCQLLSSLIGDLHDNNLDYNLKYSSRVVKGKFNSLGRELYIGEIGEDKGGKLRSGSLDISKDSKLYLVCRLFYDFQDFILIEYDISHSKDEPFIHVTRMLGDGLIRSTISYKLNRGSDSVEQIVDLAMGLAGVYRDNAHKFLYSPGYKITQHYFTRELAKDIPTLNTNAEFQKWFSPFQLLKINYRIVEFINNIPVTQCNTVDDAIYYIKHEYQKDSDKFMESNNTSIFGGEL